MSDPSIDSLLPATPLSVRALFFAAYRDLLGVAGLSVDLPEGATVADLVATLRGRGAPFDTLPREPAVAVNRAYALPTEKLHPGDEVAFIPPVAGG
ncbi:MAG TPA: MoaD/ThiS family protein [Longimicrobiales bacterium]|nr:MoaD/ThiS family protein [Longimicrobiales bacterium]